MFIRINGGRNCICQTRITFPFNSIGEQTVGVRNHSVPMKCNEMARAEVSHAGGSICNCLDSNILFNFNSFCPGQRLYTQLTAHSSHVSFQQIIRLCHTDFNSILFLRAHFGLDLCCMYMHSCADKKGFKKRFNAKIHFWFETERRTHKNGKMSGIVMHVRR